MITYVCIHYISRNIIYIPELTVLSQIFSSDSISETTFKNHDTPAMPVPYLARASSSLSVRRGQLIEVPTGV